MLDGGEGNRSLLTKTALEVLLELWLVNQPPPMPHPPGNSRPYDQGLLTPIGFP